MYMTDSPSLDIFIRESMTQNPPTREEEKALAIRFAAGDESARDELALRNTRLAMHLAKKYRGHGIELCDLVQEASIAVYESIGTFKHDKGFRFSSWASWYIKNALKAMLCTSCNAVTFPKKNCNHAEARKTIDMLKNKYGRLPTTLEFEEVSNIPGHVVETIDAMYQKPIALDAPSNGDDASHTLADNLVSEFPDTDNDTVMDSDRVFINRILAGLTDRERDIIIRRFGLGDTDPESLDPIGATHGITRERTRQIQVEATAKMQSINRMLQRGRKSISIFDVA